MEEQIKKKRHEKYLRRREYFLKRSKEKYWDTKINHPEQHKKAVEIKRIESIGNRKKYKKIALEHYGGIPPKCKCCDEKIYEFLTIDHMDGGGSKQKKENGSLRGMGIYRWLITEKYPNGYQILCMNCNFAKHFNKICPHQV